MAETSSYQIPVATLANGHSFAVTVHEFTARADGPTLLLVAGIMGDQPTGVETLRQTATLLREDTLTLIRGRVLLVPVANPYAYQHHTRNTPIDQNNLNRVFPGRSEGLFSERLAAAISDRVLRETDVLLALHSGGTFETTRYAYAFDDIDLAAALGLELILPGPSYPGTLALAARERGVRVVVSELGGHAHTPEAVAAGTRAIANLFRALEMAPGQVERPPLQRYCPDVRILRAGAGGILLSAYAADSLGSDIRGGTPLGEVVSPYSFERLETLVAPYEQSILALSRESVTHVEVGDYAFILANGASARPVEPPT